ncbi:asparagine-rich protein-like isoform X2 [Crassostrea angulata]|uniref:asparagine-rich protein-like isoform X2 n=1 Tax=Magallana angulata TaxID=2784310 RepID=UPI0022B1C64E|nr:asparagine-rich protein-like isoform X2 [Crassostrea angulata]
MCVLAVLVGSLFIGAVDSRTIGCVLESVPGTRNQFTVQVVTTGQSKVFDCANGTVFDQQACVCVNDMDYTMRPTVPPMRRTTRISVDPLVPTTRPLCRPSFALDFNSKPIADSSNMQVYVRNEGVESVVDAGQFNKQAQLNIPMFSWLGHKMTVKFRFFEWDGGDREQTLFANCQHSIAGRRGMGSIEVMLRSATKEVVFRIKTKGSEMREIAVPYPTKSWKNVTVTYDGKYFKGKVNDREATVQVRGNIESRSEGIYIGQCPRNGPGGSKRAYVGYIDDLKFYKCVLPEVPSPDLFVDRNPV